MRFLILTYELSILVCLGGSPLYAQGFDTLLNELAGSEADQRESEIGDQQKRDEHSPLPLSSTDLTAPPEDDAFAPEQNIVTDGVTLQGLDKQTARVFIIDVSVGQTVEFGTLKVVVKRCEKAPLEDRQESMAFLTITETKPKSVPLMLFSGWMFASSPALSALDHPIYDVWIKECKNLEN
ncbi:MAG: DUF2155 domain-containing protein [Alphaproteobacteria bacterium]|nr:DUF2155 domain-containing protein [Alphaproteobacteria bacterium]